MLHALASWLDAKVLSLTGPPRFLPTKSAVSGAVMKLKGLRAARRDQFSFAQGAGVQRRKDVCCS